MTSVDRLRTDTPEPANREPLRYDAELSRSLKVLGNIAIVVAAITPASSAFVIAAVAFCITGSGASLAFLVAAGLGTAMAFSWAEMGAAYPLAGGDYSFIARTLGRGAGFGISTEVLDTMLVVNPRRLLDRP